jgi:hypothetical protein
MTHLTDVELVDCLDGALPASRTAHLEACRACLDRVSALRSTMDMVAPAGRDDVPEPSPLFWEHFSRRVYEAVQDVEPLSTTARWLRAPRLGWATATAVVVLTVAVVFWSQDRQSGISPASSDAQVQRTADTDPAQPAQTTPPAADLSWNIEDDEEWALVRIVADDLQWEEAENAGLRANPGSAERVALEMTAVERLELERLIAADLKKLRS